MTGCAAQSKTWAHLLWAFDIACKQLPWHSCSTHNWLPWEAVGTHHAAVGCSQTGVICAHGFVHLQQGSSAQEVWRGMLKERVGSVGLLRWAAGRYEHEVMPLYKQAARLLGHKPAAGRTAKEGAGSCGHEVSLAKSSRVTARRVVGWLHTVVAARVYTSTCRCHSSCVQETGSTVEVAWGVTGYPVEPEGTDMVHYWRAVDP